MKPLWSYYNMTDCSLYYNSTAKLKVGTDDDSLTSNQWVLGSSPRVRHTNAVA